MSSLLENIRVVECAVLHVGDYLGCLLGDQGAEVIKVENPRLGDYIREVGGEVQPGYSLFHLMENRNKKSVTLDLKHPEAQVAFRKLVATADVFITGNVPDTPARLGFDYETLRALKPDIVYCQATGFGADGPYARIPTHGGMINGVTGDPVLGTGPDGYPEIDGTVPPPGGGMRGTVLGPLYAAFGVAAALSRRDRTGQGCYIDVSASDAVLAVSWQRTLGGLNRELLPPGMSASPLDDVQRQARAKYTYYVTKDARYVLIAAVERRFWERFCRAIDRPDLLSSHRVESNHVMDMGADEALRSELADVFRSRTQSEWIAIAREWEIPIGPAHANIEDVADDEHVRARGVFVDCDHPVVGTVRLPGNPLRVDGAGYQVRIPAPAVGEHTDEVLGGLGYSETAISALRASGAA